VKIRYKISLWIAAITLSVATMAGFVVYYEMSEESYSLVDRELLDLSERIVSSPHPDHIESQNADVDRYYVNICTKQGVNVYKSRLAGLVSLDSRPADPRFTVSIDIELEHLWIDPAYKDDFEDLQDLDGSSIMFRVLVSETGEREDDLVIIIAKPLPFITGDFNEVREQIILWSLFATLLVICLSYLMAGRILAPLKAINLQIRVINQSSLGRRITLGRSKDELNELSVSLNAMFDRLEHSFEKQREFIGNAAHEIKTPITTLLLGHENLLNNSLPPGISDDIESQLNVLRRVSLLVKNLLDISRLEQQDTIHRVKFDLSELIKDILNEFEGLISGLGITIITNLDEVQLTGDKFKIQRMLINVFDNAIKYNERNGTLKVSLSQAKKTAALVISNTGSVIPEADLPNIFDQFFRVDKSHSSQVGGFGLGLTIVKKIVELHDGTVTASSNEGETAISIALPIL